VFVAGLKTGRLFGPVRPPKAGGRGADRRRADKRGLTGSQRASPECVGEAAHSAGGARDDRDPVPDVMLTLPLAFVPVPTVISLISEIVKPLAPLPPLTRTTVAKLLPALLRVTSVEASSVAVVLDVIAVPAAWLILPAVDLTVSVGAVTAGGRRLGPR